RIEKIAVVETGAVEAGGERGILGDGLVVLFPGFKGVEAGKEKGALLAAKRGHRHIVSRRLGASQSLHEGTLCFFVDSAELAGFREFAGDLQDLGDGSGGLVLRGNDRTTSECD